MKFINIISSSIFQVLSFIFVLIYLLGVLNIYFSDKNDYCVMTYMYEYPQYVRIHLEEEKNDYPQYGLYTYSEGRFTERARKMWFDGIPVLFLPGNSGSHMQARSIASVALRKALSSNHDFYFDFFTISYNEELSGLYGGVLQRQTDYAAVCIKKILSLYRSNKFTKTIPNSVILIGHSMGGLIAKRLLAYPSTVNIANIAISLAAPLEAPVVNFDFAMNQYYIDMEYDWDVFVNAEPRIKQKKLLLGIGSGPRDILMPSGLTMSNDSYINALTTAIPGVWVSPNHVSIVWCKQLVMAINRFLFDIVDLNTDQIHENNQIIMAKARQYFQANRSMTLNPSIIRPNVSMIADAFWYEDNRRIYQIIRPEVDRPTYLMIRLVSFPQNRFVAIEAVNVDDKDWIFACNAIYTYRTHRYCNQATSLTELSRWTGAATDFGKRKLATIHLHKLLESQHDWSHVIVKVSPTRKPVVLNIDINDYESRKITVNLPYTFSFSRSVIKQETEQNSLYYELVLPDFNTIHQSYLLYIEPTASCKAVKYHVSAEVHVPWAENQEYFHYFTHLKQSPMKLRLFKTNPNISFGVDASEHVKITILLDPQCTFKISIAPSLYHRLAQFTRNYTPMLVPYVIAILLLAARSNILSLSEHGTCASIHSALMSEAVKPYYAVVLVRLMFLVFMSVPLLSYLFENASWNNFELHYFNRSLLMLPIYMIALGLLNVAAAAVIAVMVFSSQLAHRLLFRIVWRGGTGLAENVASVLHKVPVVVSAGLLFAVPFSCGAAALVAGAAYYAFMLSKMYEEYLEDYVYKLMAKVGSYICRIVKFKKNKDVSDSESSLVPTTTENDDEVVSNADVKAIEPSSSDVKSNEASTSEEKPSKPLEPSKSKNLEIESKPAIEIANVEKGDNKEIGKELEVAEVANTSVVENKEKHEEETKDERDESKVRRAKRSSDVVIDEDLNSLNFHMMMFFLWLAVTLVNVPALLTWARNFKYGLILIPDTSYYVGIVMSACSGCVWLMDGPRGKLRLYEYVASLLFVIAIAILVLGPTSLGIVSYAVTFVFLIITLQQLFDKEVDSPTSQVEETNNVDCDVQQDEKKTEEPNDGTNDDQPADNDKKKEEQDSSNTSTSSSDADSSTTSTTQEDCECSESRIYSVFKTLRDKISFNQDL